MPVKFPDGCMNWFSCPSCFYMYWDGICRSQTGKKGLPHEEEEQSHTFFFWQDPTTSFCLPRGKLMTCGHCELWFPCPSIRWLSSPAVIWFQILCSVVPVKMCYDLYLCKIMAMHELLGLCFNWRSYLIVCYSTVWVRVLRRDMSKSSGKQSWTNHYSGLENMWLYKLFENWLLLYTMSL